MDRPGSSARPLRVAVVGSGPAGFYTVQHLLQRKGLDVEVDVLDRLPAPFGLVRYGVAPDHQKIKNVIAVYDRLARDPRVRFYGRVEYGTTVGRADLERHYDQTVVCTGAQTDRRLGIPGEDLPGSHPATDFVAWYNGHPDYVDRVFDLSADTAVVIGVGNVAVDVARILCRTPAELGTTDIADHALAALAESRVRRVVLVGRRGPAQAAFTPPEVEELGELSDACASTVRAEVELDAATRQSLGPAPDKGTLRKIELLQRYAERSEPGKRRLLELRFLLSPIEIVAGSGGDVAAIRLARTRLALDPSGDVRAVATDETETLPAGLVFRSVGYRGVALPDLPFDERSGTIPSDRGRVRGPDGAPLPGLYVAGWIKRGPSGVIGTNKPDAAETVEQMLADLDAGQLARPTAPDRAAFEALLRERGVRWVSYDDWRQLDALEIESGQAVGRVRRKLVRYEEFLRSLA
jgi:ferredoxin/flavodoxin---NADP+ reductase